MPKQNKKDNLQIFINHTDQTNKLLNHIHEIEIEENLEMTSYLIISLHSTTVNSVQIFLKIGDMIEIRYKDKNNDAEGNKNDYLKCGNFYLYDITHINNNIVKLTAYCYKYNINISIRPDYNLNSSNFKLKPLGSILDMISAFIDLDTEPQISPEFQDWIIDHKKIDMSNYSNYLNMLKVLANYSDASIYIKNRQLFFIKKHKDIPVSNLEVHVLPNHISSSTKQSEYEGLTLAYKHNNKIETLTKGKGDCCILFSKERDTKKLKDFLEKSFHLINLPQKIVDVKFNHFQNCTLESELLFTNQELKLSESRNTRFFINKIKHKFSMTTSETVITADEDPFVSEEI